MRGLVIFWLDIKDTTDTLVSASYLDVYIEIDNEDRFRSKLFGKLNDLKIVNFVSICGHFPAAHVYEVYASQLKQYWRECTSNFDLLVREWLLMSKPLIHEFN